MDIVNNGRLLNPSIAGVQRHARTLRRALDAFLDAPRDIAARTAQLRDVPELRASPKERGRARAEQFSWRNFALKTLKVIER